MTAVPRPGWEEVDVERLLSVLRRFQAGDLDARLPDDWEGVGGRVAETVNDLIAITRHNTRELERVARIVGKEGRLEERMTAAGGGSWAQSVRMVNELIEDLVRADDKIAQVIGAVARGDLSQSVPMEVYGRPLLGHFASTARTVNTMVDQLSAFSSEVTRVAREVGTEGQLGGQARVAGVSGVWKDLTDSVNRMANNLTIQVRNIAEVTTAVARGDLSREITVEGRGEILELKNTINVMVEQLNTFSAEVTRVAREVGTEGKLGGQAQVPDVSGVWKDLTDHVNQMAANLTGQVRNIAEVTTAVARGDLSREITVEGRGEILELKDTINQMVGRLNAFTVEVTRVAREVGTEGKLGGQAQVPGLAGVWGDLADNVNLLAAQLTQQIRNVAEVMTAVARGDLSKKVTVDVQGEILDLKDTINVMVDQLNAFASEVTRVAHEVGTEGKLGGQAQVPDVAGIWKELTDNVNHLAKTLTDQIRAIADVATSVTEGDLTRSIGVEAFGEVAVLKDELNEMIRNLRETTLRNTEQDWLKSHLAEFNRMLQGQRDLAELARMILSELAPLVSAQQGALFMLTEAGGRRPVLRFQAGYAYLPPDDQLPTFRLGEGLVGQCALEQRPIILEGVPDRHFDIVSGLGSSPPRSVVVLPVLFEGKTKAVIELASLERFLPLHLDFLGQLTGSIGIVINTIQANSRTEELLAQSQSLAGELQAQQEELRQTNEELQQKARLLAEQNAEVERNKLEVEQTSLALAEKAEQLALTSRYKSEFLANMSHELRTPLNAMLILADQLAENQTGTLSDRQVEFADTIKASGEDLLTLINDILDLSRIESGNVPLEVGEISCAELASVLEQSFRHVAESRSLLFDVDVAPGLPALRTDSKRLQQVLKNLLSNAFKFTHHGHVALRMRPADRGTETFAETPDGSSPVIAIDVEDTGIGIDEHQHEVIFEGFKQADGTTSRTYGGTGLGLSISRNLVRLLGGRITLRSSPGEGSCFTVLLPLATPLEVRQPVDAPILSVREEGAPAWSGHDSAGRQDAAMPGAVDAAFAGPGSRPAGLPSVPPGSSSLPSTEAVRSEPDAELDEASGREAGAQLSESSRADPTLLQGRSVLVVDDDARSVFALAALLETRGATVDVAQSGEEALDRLRGGPAVDLMLLDIMMPRKDGYETLRELRSLPGLAGLPVIAVTARAMPGDREQSLEAGATEYIAKPVRPDELVALATRLMAPQ